MAWRRPGDKPLSELMMVSLLTHICVTRPQWVKWTCDYLSMPGLKLIHSNVSKAGHRRQQTEIHSLSTHIKLVDMECLPTDHNGDVIWTSLQLYQLKNIQMLREITVNIIKLKHPIFTPLQGSISVTSFSISVASNQLDIFNANTYIL